MATLHKLLEQMREEQKKKQDMFGIAHSQMASFSESLKLMSSDLLKETQKFKELLEVTPITHALSKAIETSKLMPMINKNLHSLTCIPPINSSTKDIEIKLEVIKESDDIDVFIYEDAGKIIVKVKKYEE